jgi:hypothetical protein
MTDKNRVPTIDDMQCIDAETGEEIPISDAEKAEALEALKAAMRSGDVIFAPQALERMKEKGLTPEQVEAWLSEKH